MRMTLEQFADQLERSGADLERWPQRDLANELLATDPRARALLDEARELAVLLHRALPVPQVPTGRIRAEVGARLARRRRWHPAMWFSAGVLRPVFAATVPLGLGFVLGFGLNLGPNLGNSAGDPADLQMLTSLDLLSLEQGATLDAFLDSTLTQTTTLTEDSDDDS